MRTCPECGAQFEDGKSFCPGCGKYLPLSAASVPEKSVPALSEDPVAKLLNIDVPNLTENTPDFGKEAFAKIFKESLAESAPERVAPAPEKPEGNPPKREVSWETSYKETHEEELENLDDFGKPSSAPEKATCAMYFLTSSAVMPTPLSDTVSVPACLSAITSTR